jgi:hypothetical protein
MTPRFTGSVVAEVVPCYAKVVCSVNAAGWPQAFLLQVNFPEYSDAA